MAVIMSKKIVVPTCMKTITITGTTLSSMSGDKHMSSVTVNDVVYTSATTLEVENGTVITLQVQAEVNATGTGWIAVDGKQVATVTDSEIATYEYTVTSDIKIVIAYDSTSQVGTIQLTEV